MKIQQIVPDGQKTSALGPVAGFGALFAVIGNVLFGRFPTESEVVSGQPAAVMQPEVISVIGTMPMSTLANFGGMSLDHDALDRVADAWRQPAAVT